MTNPLTLWLAWLREKRAAHLIRIAERRRAAIANQKADRKAHKREWRSLDGELRQETCRSLAASCGREWR